MLKGGFRRVGWRVVAAFFNLLARLVAPVASGLLSLMMWFLALAQSARRKG